MSKPWSGAGAWAADAERADAEAKDVAAAAATAAAFGPAAEAFPTLGEAVSAKPQKKKKNQAISLSELVTGKYVGPGGGKTKQISDSSKLTPNEMMMLPTGPRDRSDEEPQHGGLGGGFKDYGGYRGGSDRDHERGDRDRDGDRGYGERSRDRGFGGGFEREKAAAGFDGPSRADETDDWGATKKFVPSQVGGGYDDDRRGGRSSDRDLPSRADEVENWGTSKKFTPSNGFDRKSSGFGFDDTRRGYEEAPSRRSGGGYQEAPSRKGGYEEGPRRSGGFEEVPGRGLNSRADETGDWGSTKKFVPSAAPLANRGWDSGPDTDRWSRREQTQNGSSNISERPRLVLQPRSRNVDDDESLPPKVETLIETADATQPKVKSNPFGAARPREEVLAEKGQDWRKIGSDLSTRDKDSRPSSSHSSRPATPDSSIDLPVKARPKVNPFGDAKPREVLLQEKGKDWRKIDFELEHKSVDRPLSEEEKKLKEEIDFLSLQLTQENEHYGESENSKVSPVEEINAAGEKQSIKQQLYEKERELEQLTRALDDKVRFSQRGGDRPVSRSGRSEAGTGRVYEPPRGEGRVADVWTRQSDVDRERRGRDRFDDMPRRR